MLKMIDKTNCWLLAVFVGLQFTPWHQTEVHFNRHVQQWPLGLEIVSPPMQFLSSLFLECPDKLVINVRRQPHGTVIIKGPVCQTSHQIADTDTFANLPSSFHRKQAREVAIPEASTEHVQKCNNWSQTSIFNFSCERFETLLEQLIKYSVHQTSLSISDAERFTNVPLQLSQAIYVLEQKCDVCSKNKHEARFCLICQCSPNTSYFHQGRERSWERYMTVSEMSSSCFGQEISPARLAECNLVVISLFFLFCFSVYHLVITHYNSANPMTRVASLITAILTIFIFFICLSLIIGHLFELFKFVWIPSFRVL